MYFADLTPYTYFKPHGRNSVECPQYRCPVLNVGWLDDEHDFPKGDVPDEVLAKLFVLCSKPVWLTRGRHSCQLCSERRLGSLALRRGVELAAGNGEIRVPSPSGIVYASPTMVYHYISDHQYKPPQDYIDSILKLRSHHGWRKYIAKAMRPFCKL